MERVITRAEQSYFKKIKLDGKIKENLLLLFLNAIWFFEEHTFHPDLSHRCIHFLFCHLTSMGIYIQRHWLLGIFDLK